MSALPDLRYMRHRQNAPRGEVCSLIEHGHIVAGPGSPNLKEAFIPDEDFAVLEGDTELVGPRKPLGAATRSKGRSRLKAGSHLGVISVPGGASIEILPKITGRDGPEEIRKVVGRMLAEVDDPDHREVGEALLQTPELEMLQCYLWAFLRRVKHLVSRGLRSGYVTLEDRLPSLRGRLLLREQVRLNDAQRAQFCVRYDEFSVDRAENRLVRSAVARAGVLARSLENRRLARELAFALEEVPLSRSIKRDFELWRDERGANQYRGLKGWCGLILGQNSPHSAAGNSVIDSFLFPAEKLFEAYVAARLERCLCAPGSGYSLEIQRQDRALFSGDAAGPFGKTYGMRPDMVVRRQGQPWMIIDTKWKVFDEESENTRVPQGDLYQLYAYAQNWFHVGPAGDDQERHVVVVAPKADQFTAIQGGERFARGVSKAKLWVYPYDLAADTADNADCALASWILKLSKPRASAA